MFKNPLYVLISAVVAAAAFAFAVPAHAQPRAPSETVSTAVSYADLNLGSVEGARTVLHRIRSAASAICYGGVNYDECFDQAVSGAVARLNSPIVTSMSGRAHAQYH